MTLHIFLSHIWSITCFILIPNPHSEYQHLDNPVHPPTKLQGISFTRMLITTVILLTLEPSETFFSHWPPIRIVSPRDPSGTPDPSPTIHIPP